MSILGDKIKEAYIEKANDINSFIWKGPKVKDVQEEIRLVDASFEQLHKFYNHCMQMLYNTDSKHPGRLILLDIIADQIQRCRAELLIRWMRSEKHYTNTNCLEDIKTLIKNNPNELTNESIKTIPISTIVTGLPLEYERIPISLVMDACLDALGIFDNSHLTLSFIVRMGLWFTNQEMQKDLYKKDPNTGKAMNRLELVAKEFHLDKLEPPIELRAKDTGLSYTEFKTMLKLQKDKYANLTSDQLRLLSDKILYRLQDQCERQAKQWQDKISEIIKVAESKNWDITRDI